jgi:hypothetical protein
MSTRANSPRRSRRDRATVRRLLDLLRAGKDVRVRKARLTRAKIRVRQYDNDLKLAIAIDRLLRDL